MLGLGFLAACCLGNVVAAMPDVLPPAGPAALRLLPGGVTFSNRTLAATWRLTATGLAPGTITGVGTGESVSLTGELFQIQSSDGPSIKASGFGATPEARVVRVEPEPTASRWAERVGGSAVEVRLRSPGGNLAVTWRLIGYDDAHYFRQELELMPLSTSFDLREIGWLDGCLDGARTAGLVDGSPIVAGNLFLGIEDPMAVNEVAEASRLRCRLRRGSPLAVGERLVSTFVIGVAPPGQMRRGFLSYLERERAHPYRPFLHYNSWYDIAWTPFALNETNCLEAIRLFGERFIEPYQVTLDALVFDDGWDDPRTLWKFHAGFPQGFTPLAQLAKRYRSRLGVWLSPFGGYGEPRERRLDHGRQQGYETNATGFSLAGPKYYAAFKEACVGMIRNYGVNHFKFDGIAAGMYADGSAGYLRDTEAMRRLMLELRHEDPGLYINLTTGSWPSPFWLRFADSVWRQGGDMGFAGKGPKQQQWLTYRDQEVYRNIVRKGPLFPLNSLMTQGVAYSRQGYAGDPSFDSRGFKDDVRAFFGSGTGLQELYLQPDRLTPEDWRVLAEAATWSRRNADVLVDTHWWGGDPGQLQVYGYAAWSPRLGVLMLRNPDDQPQQFTLDLGTAFELPADEPSRYQLVIPWTGGETPAPALEAVAGSPLRLSLAAFEVRVIEARPLGR